MKTFSPLTLHGFALVWALAASLPAAAPEGDWKSVHAMVVPAPAETGWRSIPWRTDLWEARREAARAGKPLFLWEMDGHPLGCT